MMKLKFVILALFVSTTLFAQENRREKVRALKVAYITEQLELTPEEAQKFWPIYNVYQEKMSKVHSKERQMLRSLRSEWENISEDKAKAGLETILQAEKDKMLAKETLLKELRTTLSYKKTLVLMKAEEDFKRKLLDRLKGDRSKRGTERKN